MKVYASILQSNVLDLSADIERYLSYGVDGIHLDVMDGHYVPQMAFGQSWIKHISHAFSCPLHVHLMVSQVSVELVQECVEGGASCVMVHPKTWTGSLDQWQSLSEICELMVVINPHEASSDFTLMTQVASGVMLMCVQPGRSGGSFIPEVLHDVQVNTTNLWLDGGIGMAQRSLIQSVAPTGVVIGSALETSDAARMVRLYQG